MLCCCSLLWVACLSCPQSYSLFALTYYTLKSLAAPPARMKCLFLKEEFWLYHLGDGEHTALILKAYVIVGTEDSLQVEDSRGGSSAQLPVLLPICWVTLSKIPLLQLHFPFDFKICLTLCVAPCGISPDLILVVRYWYSLKDVQKWRFWVSIFLCRDEIFSHCIGLAVLQTKYFCRRDYALCHSLVFSSILSQ